MHSGIPPRKTKKKEVRTGLGGERRVREAREIKGSGFERNRYERNRILDVYIAQDIERDAYLAKRRALMSDKRSIQEYIARLEADGNAWLEPMRAWITEAENLAQIRNFPSLPAKKSALQKIFGLNLILRNQKLSGTAHPVYAAVAAAREKSGISDQNLVWAPRVGFEPTTNSLHFSNHF